jgi:hypothetical protein
MAKIYFKRPHNVPTYPFPGPLKFTQIGIFGLKIYHLATLRQRTADHSCVTSNYKFFKSLLTELCQGNKPLIFSAQPISHEHAFIIIYSIIVHVHINQEGCSAEISIWY